MLPNLHTLALIKKILLLSLVSILLSAGCKKKNTPPNPIVPPTPAWDPNAIRGVWVTTTASTALDNRDQIKQMVATCKTAGITIFL
jgi:uncharacterized lipoprotein YddW (UPF0748 family)